MSRESDIQSLCKQVLEEICVDGGEPDYGQSDYCPFCIEEGDTMEEVEHSGNCAYLIAKDLMTGIK